MSGNESKLIANTSLDITGTSCKKSVVDLRNFMDLPETYWVGKKIRKNLNDCCKDDLVFNCRKCGNIKVIKKTCGYRICSKCEKTRRYRMKKRYINLLKRFNRPKLLTLTMEGVHSDIKEKKKEMTKYVREFFRRTKLDGLRVYEIKKKSEGYSIHIHCIIDSPYLPQKRISKLWESVTKTSYIVDIRVVSSNKALSYVLKYVSKCPDGITVNEYTKYYYKQRMLTKFGKYYNLKIEELVTDFLNCENCDDKLNYIPFWNELNLIQKSVVMSGVL